MDPFSIIAGVVGTAGVALHLSRDLYEMIDTIINGPTELVAMRRDARDCFNILASLEPMLREKEVKEDNDILNVIQGLSQPLDNCMSTLKDLETFIQKCVKPSGDQKRAKWRSFASAFREKELKSLADQLVNGKLTLGLALTTITTIRSARIQKNTNNISSQIDELRADLKNQDNEKIQLASVRGRKGSDSRTDFGFALERFLENVSVMGRPPSQGSVHSDGIENTVNSPSETIGNSTSIKELRDPSSNKDKVGDGEGGSRKANRIEFHPVNTSVYDGRWSVPSTYDEIRVVPIVIDAIGESQRATTELNMKARRGDIETLKVLLRGDVTLPADERGNTPVHEASANGQVEVLEFLLSMKPDLEAVDDHGLTALHKAASGTSNCSAAILHLLIEHGARIESTDDLGATPLHHAAWYGSDGAASLLLQHGANADLQDNAGWSPLHLAAYRGNKWTMEHLLNKAYGCSINALGPGGTTALMWATEKGYESLVKNLLENGAAVNLVDRSGNTALHHAAPNGFMDMIEVLVAYGGNIELPNNKAARLLHIATQYGQCGAVERLLSFGADPNSAGTNGWPALHQAAGRGHTDIIDILLSRNANIEVRGEYNKTAIIWAGEIGQSGSVRSLIAHGANVNAMDQFGETSLHYASANGYSDIVRTLVSKGANVLSANNRLRHPLHGAASEFGGVYPTTKILLDHGADPNAKAIYGWTPLHFAAQTSNQRVVQLLLEHGANWQERTDNGDRAVDIATKNGHMDVVRILQDAADDSPKN